MISIKQPHKILVVDDSRVFCFQVKELLESEHYEVLLEMSTDRVMDIVRQQRPDLVIMDVIMPHHNGYDICREIKNYASQQGLFIPVILLTALDHVDNKVEGLDSGADDFLSKPPSQKELLARVRGLLRLSDLQSNLREAHDRLEKAHQLIQREISLVGQIQRSFLPKQFPFHPRLDLAAFYKPSVHAGGDYYDVIEIDEHHWGFVMADVAGHGMSAAVVMALTQMAVKEFAKDCTQPNDALLIINEKLNHHLSSNHFVTMFYAVLNLETMEMTYASAGHNPMMHYCAPQQEVNLLQTDSGFPLRTFENQSYHQQQIHLNPGDKLLLFTDGVTDVINEEKDFFGEVRLKQTFFESANVSTEIIVQTIYQNTEIFRDGHQRADDFTLMVAAIK